MKVSVVYALPDEQMWLPLDVEEGATILTVIHQSGILNIYPEIQLDIQKVGIFGKQLKLDSLVNEGDRVEVYRPITWQPEEDDED